MKNQVIRYLIRLTPELLKEGKEYAKRNERTLASTFRYALVKLIEDEKT